MAKNKKTRLKVDCNVKSINKMPAFIKIRNLKQNYQINIQWKLINSTKTLLEIILKEIEDTTCNRNFFKLGSSFSVMVGKVD